MHRFARSEESRLGYRRLNVVLLLAFSINASAVADVTVTVARKNARKADGLFQFDRIANPSRDDAGVTATITLVSGTQDANGASTKALTDGNLPEGRDQPSANWFLAGNAPGRLLFDFGRPIDLREIRSYSWHPSTRADQVYEVYLPSGSNELPASQARASATNDDWTSHWNRLVSVDSREGGSDSTQVAISIAGSADGPIARTQFVLLSIRPTSPRRFHSQTFFSEIDFVDGKSYAPPPEPEKRIDTLEIDGFATINFDSTETPSLRPWITETLMPACKLWYPRIVKTLPSDGFTAPKSFEIVFRDAMRGVAYTSGKDVYCAGPWYRKNLDGEATGSVIHELVHVVQQYGRSGGPRPPGWVTEGIADHIRWYQYEPKEKRRRVNWQRANYDDAYFPSATFLDYIVRNIDANAIRKINADARQGKFRDGYWLNRYGKTADAIWKAAEAEANRSKEPAGSLP